ncbi:hypothetical protein T11_8768 [Trichinella zimbabwensis]|uniref:Uncharacterized protein n=1 Tax=Trichinella zimbabwensis TaxID=268475 RepID=A0A0V1HKR4_9BILA|nr:hypothetical protein T11_8768 [Trichinella zimbabwensis]
MYKNYICSFYMNIVTTRCVETGEKQQDDAFKDKGLWESDIDQGHGGSHDPPTNTSTSLNC